MTGKPVIDDDKVTRWAEELANGEGILGQLTWNFRQGETEIHYDPAEKKLAVTYGEAHIPDSGHRHLAIVEAAKSVERGSNFDLGRKVSVRIYNVAKEDEPRIFYAYNQEGTKADPTRSKWLFPKEATQRIASEFVRRAPDLSGNVDTVRDRISRKNPRLTAFNTVSRAFEDNWEGADIGGDNFEPTVEWLIKFWEKLNRVLPQLGKLDIAKRRAIRNDSVIDSAVAIHGYIALAYRMYKDAVPLDRLEKLEPNFFDRKNPLWERIGVLASGVRKDGTKVTNIRNANQSRRAMRDALLKKVGLEEPSKNVAA